MKRERNVINKFILKISFDHYRLDQILGKQGSKAKDVYASKISLASRVVKIERQVDDIETKLDQLIELYMEDRKRILTIPLNHDSQAQITGK